MTSIRGPIQDYFSNAHTDRSLLVAVGHAVNTDGIPYTWTSNSATVLVDGLLRSGTDMLWHSVAYSPTLRLFVAVTHASSTDIYYSVDGVTWTPVTDPGALSSNAVYWSSADSMFIVSGIMSGTTSQVWTSVNGTTWTVRAFTTGVNVALSRVEYAPALDIYVGLGSDVGLDGDGMYSSDGITWTPMTTGASNVDSWNSIAWSPSLGIFTAVGSYNTGNKCVSSTDGTTWTQRATPTPTTIFWNSVCWSPEKAIFVAVGWNTAGSVATVMTSTNGTSWTQRTITLTAVLSTVIWSKWHGMFIAAGDRYLVTSPDGMTWTTSAVTVAASDVKSIAIRT